MRSVDEKRVGEHKIKISETRSEREPPVLSMLPEIPHHRLKGGKMIVLRPQSLTVSLLDRLYERVRLRQEVLICAPECSIVSVLVGCREHSRGMDQVLVDG
jgi:hypothetical protein